MQGHANLIMLIVGFVVLMLLGVQLDVWRGPIVVRAELRDWLFGLQSELVVFIQKLLFSVSCRVVVRRIVVVVREIVVVFGLALVYRLLILLIGCVASLLASALVLVAEDPVSLFVV